MQKFIRNQEMTEENQDELKVREYMNKYIKELQRHFDLPDKKMRMILYKIYKELSPYCFIKTFLKNQFSMIKSIYGKKIFFKRKLK